MTKKYYEITKKWIKNAKIFFNNFSNSVNDESKQIFKHSDRH